MSDHADAAGPARTATKEPAAEAKPATPAPTAGAKDPSGSPARLVKVGAPVEDKNPVLHVVQKGETLESIAKHYHLLHPDWIVTHPLNAELFGGGLSSAPGTKNGDGAKPASGKVHPGFLPPDTKLWIPPRTQAITCRTGKLYTFRLRPIRPMPPVSEELALSMARELAMTAYQHVEQDAKQRTEDKELWKKYSEVDPSFSKKRDGVDLVLTASFMDEVVATKEKAEAQAKERAEKTGVQATLQGTVIAKGARLLKWLGHTAEKGMGLLAWLEEQHEYKQVLAAAHQRDMMTEGGQLLVADAHLTWFQQQAQRLQNKDWEGDAAASEREKGLLLLEDALSSDVQTVLRKCIVHLRWAEELLEKPVGDLKEGTGELPPGVKPGSAIARVLQHPGEFATCSDMVAATKYAMQFLHQADKFKVYLLPTLNFLVFVLDEYLGFLEVWDRVRKHYEDPIVDFMRRGNHEVCKTGAPSAEGGARQKPKCLRTARDRRAVEERYAALRPKYASPPRKEAPQEEGAKQEAAPAPKQAGPAHERPVHAMHLPSYRARLAQALWHFQHTIQEDEAWASVRRDADDAPVGTPTQVRYMFFKHDLMECYRNKAWWEKAESWIENQWKDVTATELFDKAMDEAVKVGELIKREVFQPYLERNELRLQKLDELRERNEKAAKEAKEKFNAAVKKARAEMKRQEKIAERDAQKKQEAAEREQRNAERAAAGEEPELEPSENDRIVGQGADGKRVVYEVVPGQKDEEIALEEEEEEPEEPEEDIPPATEAELELHAGLAVGAELWGAFGEQATEKAKGYVQLVRARIEAQGEKFEPATALLPDDSERFEKAQKRALAGRTLKDGAIKLKDVFADLHEHFQAAHAALEHVQEALPDPDDASGVELTSCEAAYTYARILFTFQHELDAMDACLVPLIDYVSHLVAAGYRLTTIEQAITRPDSRCGLYVKVWPFLADVPRHDACVKRHADSNTTKTRVCYGPQSPRHAPALPMFRLRGQKHEPVQVDFVLPKGAKSLRACVGVPKPVTLRTREPLVVFEPHAVVRVKSEHLLEQPVVHVMREKTVALTFSKGGKARLELEPLHRAHAGEGLDVVVDLPQVEVVSLDPPPKVVGDKKGYEANTAVRVKLRLHPKVEGKDLPTVTIESKPEGLIKPTKSKPFASTTEVVVRIQPHKDAKGADITDTMFELHLTGQGCEARRTDKGQEVEGKGYVKLTRLAPRPLPVCEITKVDPERKVYVAGDHVTVHFAIKGRSVLSRLGHDRATVKALVEPSTAIVAEQTSAPFFQNEKVTLVIKQPPAGVKTCKLKLEAVDGCTVKGEREFSVHSSVPAVKVALDKQQADYKPGEEVVATLTLDPPFGDRNETRARIRVSGDVLNLDGTDGPVRSGAFGKKCQVHFRIKGRTDKNRTSKDKLHIIIEPDTSEGPANCKLVDQFDHAYDVKVPTVRMELSKPKKVYAPGESISVELWVEPALPSDRKAKFQLKGDKAGVLSEEPIVELYKHLGSTKLTLGNVAGDVLVVPLDPNQCVAGDKAKFAIPISTPKLTMTAKPTKVARGKSVTISLKLSHRYGVGDAKFHITAFGEPREVSFHESESVTFTVPQDWPDKHANVSAETDSPDVEIGNSLRLEIEGTADSTYRKR